MPLYSLIRRFFGDRGGNVAVICAFMFLPMLLIAGGATDIARHESYRVQLQDGVDRAVLAAASLTQTRQIEVTVRDYLKGLPFIDEVNVQFASQVTGNSRQVTVTASYVMKTGFLPLMGVEELPVRVVSTALERRKNIEISLMLDISGSMREGNPSKISLLKPAAQQFIDIVLSPDKAPFTSVSIVPYAGQVSVGADIFNALGGARTHGNSSCFEFAGTEYTAGLVNFSGRAQVPHFTHWNYNQNVAGMNWWWCPTDDTALSILSNDAAYLKQRIANYKMHDGTGTAIAMKWGMMLLDPVARPFMAMAAQYGVVSSNFASRPANWNDGDTLKFIVLMTDGAISEQFRPKDPNRPVNQPPDNKELHSKTVTTNQMYALCNAAKANNVTVFTIGFQVSSTAQTQMRDCASSPSHFYNVEGLDIARAFQSIASAIQQVRLTR